MSFDVNIHGATGTADLRWNESEPHTLWVYLPEDLVDYIRLHWPQGIEFRIVTEKPTVVRKDLGGYTWDGK